MLGIINHWYLRGTDMENRLRVGHLSASCLRVLVLMGTPDNGTNSLVPFHSLFPSSVPKEAGKLVSCYKAICTFQQTFGFPVPNVVPRCIA